jgi:UDP-glucose 4-epimerase
VRALVLGGNGFIGSHIVDQLLAKGADVTVYDRSPRERYRAPLRGVTYVRGELGNRGELENTIGRGVDTVVHLISSTVPKTSNDDPIFDVQMNLVESLALFDLCVKHRVNRVVFISSGGTVYGVPKASPICEDHPTDPICSYGIVKLAIEKYLQLYQSLYGLNYVVLRLANPYGARQDPATIQGATSVFIGKVLRGEPIRLWGDGTIIRDFVNVRDVAELCAAVAFSSTQGIFNAGTGVGTSIRQVIELIGNELQTRPEVIQEPRRPFDVPAVVLCSERAYREFGWRPRINLRTGIREQVEWLQQLGRNGKYL